MMDLKGTPYWEIYGEVFQFFKQALPVQNNDHYWGDVLAAGEAIVKRYENTAQAAFAEDQVFSIVNELERLKKVGSFDSLRPGAEKTKIGQY